MERLGAPVPELSSDLLPKDQVLAPCVSDHSCRSNRHQHRQPVFLARFDSTQSPQQLNDFEAKLADMASVAWLMTA